MDSRRIFLSRALTAGLFYGAGGSIVRAQFASPDQPGVSDADAVRRYGEMFVPSQDLSDWMETLKRPDIVAGKPHHGDLSISAVSCCSAGDAYPIDIIEEASPPHGGEEENGVARVTDPHHRQILLSRRNANGSVYKETKYRQEITGPLTFHFSSDKVTREKDGNPTKTAWVFCRVVDGNIDLIYCVVPLPPAM